ncbi:MAG: GWxTD domain-containing protein [bacterium]|nr:MAG: GWxTD domain-containing protein [bacterium]
MISRILVGLSFLTLISVQVQSGKTEFATFSMESPWRSSGALDFFMDICQYQGVNGKTRCEIIYSIDIAPFLSLSDKAVTLNLNLTVSDSNKVILDSIPVQHDINLSDPLLMDKTHRYVDMIMLELPAGRVTFDVNVFNEKLKLEGNIKEQLYIKNLGSGFSISDPYFVSGIDKASDHNKFEKYGLLLIPNPARVFQVDSTSCKFFVYHEINNMYYDPDSPTAFSCHYQVFDLAGNEYLHKPEIRKIKETKSSSRIEVVTLNEAKSGIYRLVITVVDLETDQRQSVSHYFWLTGGDIDEGHLLALSESELDQYFHQIKYLLTDKDKEIINELNFQAKQEFLLKFWKSKDPDPSTLENEFMIEYLKKVTYVQNTFKNGIDSDMGRIYLQYGMPTEIDRQISNPGSIKSVIIWRYALNGITEFVFLDRTGDEQYLLVHSNHPDEFNNPDWIQNLIDNEIGSSQFR